MCSRAPDVALQEDGVVAERGARFLPRFLQSAGEISRPVDHAHAAAAAAERGLDDQRKADLARRSSRPAAGSVTGFSVPGTPGCPPSPPGAARRSCRRADPADRALGPTKVMPARSQARGSAGFSDRNP